MNLNNIIIIINDNYGRIKYLIYNTETDMYLHNDNVWLSSNMKDFCEYYSLGAAEKELSKYINSFYVPISKIKPGQRFKKTYDADIFRVIEMPSFIVNQSTSLLIFYINEKTHVVNYTTTGNNDLSRCILLND